MLRTTGRMQDLTIHAIDGTIGRVQEFYFDDETWAIRYVIVDTGNWLSGRLVLLSPIFLRNVDWEKLQLHVALAKSQIENSPNIETDKPVSRQHEAEYMNYYGYPYYWGSPFLWGVGAYPMDLYGASSVRRRKVPAERQSADSHLRSTKEVKGYHIDAADEEIGHIEDFIVDPLNWSIRYLDVSTRNWLPGKHVLIAPEWIEKVSWVHSRVSVSLLRATIKEAPEYLESRPITREYEHQLHAYYAKQPYWLRDTVHS